MILPGYVISPVPRRWTAPSPGAPGKQARSKHIVSAALPSFFVVGCPGVGISRRLRAQISVAGTDGCSVLHLRISGTSDASWDGCLLLKPTFRHQWLILDTHNAQMRPGTVVVPLGIVPTVLIGLYVIAVAIIWPNRLCFGVHGCRLD